jgi:hypothetical protein
MPGVTPTETAPYSVTLLVDGEIMPVPRVLAEIAARPEVIDIASSEAPLEEVIRLMYGEVGKNAGQETSEATTI